MYSLFIVDDEDLILDNLKEVVDWESLGFKIDGTFSNGQLAFDAIIKNPPDVVLTDIKMPIKDGLSLLSDIRAYGLEDIKVIFLTGYDDFSYAQQSLRLNASDYILKPSDFDKIHSIFLKLKKELDTSAKRTNKILQASATMMRNHLFRSTIHGDFKAYAAFLKLYEAELPQGIDTSYYTISIAPKPLTTQNQTACLNYKNQKRKIEAIIRKAMSKYLEETDTFEPYIYAEHNFWITTLIFCSIPLETAEALLLALWSQLERDHITIEIGVGNFTHNINDIQRSYHQSIARLFSVDAIYAQTLSNILNGNQLQKAIQSKNEEKIRRVFSQLISDIKETATDQSQLLNSINFLIFTYLQTITDKQKALSYYSNTIDLQLISQSAQTMALHVIQALDVKYTNREKTYKLCLTITNYIDTHYSESLTVTSLANVFFISTSYLNKIFKQNIGISIHDYVTIVRLNKADQLLCEKQYKLYEIAEKVGYSSYEHFRQVYVKKRGINPSQVE